jgi:hypothetical protein
MLIHVFLDEFIIERERGIHARSSSSDSDSDLEHMLINDDVEHTIFIITVKNL